MGKFNKTASSMTNSETHQLKLHHAFYQNLHRSYDYSSDAHQKLSQANQLLKAELDLSPNADWDLIKKTFLEFQDVEVSYQTSQLFCNYAISLYLQGKFDESLKYFELAVSRRFKEGYHNTQAYWFLSLIYSELQQIEAASKYSELCAQTGGFYTHGHPYIVKGESIPGKYPRLEFSWTSTLLILHFSKEQQHYLHLCISDAGLTPDGLQAAPIWLKTEAYDSDSAHEELKKLVADPLHLLNVFEAPETETVMRAPAQTGWLRVFSDSAQALNRAHAIERLFGSFQFAIDIPPNDTNSPQEDLFSGGRLAAGNELVTKFKNSLNFPNTPEDVMAIARFFAQPQMITGLFGNFKFLLKELTSRFEALIAQDPSQRDLVDQIAGCLGLGYGQIEGYLSKGTMSPKYFLDWDSENLRLLSTSDLFQDRYPSLRTAQYLSRKSLNLLKELRKKGVYSTEFAFKMQALESANQFDERSARFPEYQLLTNEIVFGPAEVIKAYDSRKYYSPREVDLSESVKKEVALMTEIELNLAKQWCQSADSFNPSTLLYSFELGCEFGIERDLNRDQIAMLSRFKSERIFAAISKKLQNNPQVVYQSIDSEFSLDYLLVADDEVLSNIRLSEKDALKWLNSYKNFPFDNRGVQLSILSLRGLTFNRTGETLELQTELMFKLGKHSHFEPFEEWGSCFDWMWGLDLETKLRVLGLYPDQPGALAYVKDISQELIQKLASLLQQWDEENLSKIVIALLNSHHQVSEPLLTEMLSSGGWYTDRLFNSSSDPRILLAILKAKLETSSADTILGFLERLAAEDKAVFWRMNGHEAEAVFRNWMGFGRFVWEKSENLPKIIHETFDGYSWLSEAITSAINSADIAKLSELQASLLEKCISIEPTVLEDETFLRATLTAPNLKLNALATNHAKKSGTIDRHWLFMLESNLPITAEAGLDYLTQLKETPDFDSKLMMALDSNDKFARSSALNILASLSSSEHFAKTLIKLAESRHLDVWDFVSRKLSSVSDSKALRQFTSTLFLSHLKARSQKERVKEEIQLIPEGLGVAVDQETLIRMALGSAAKDREWALRQLATLGIDFGDVSVEASWKVGKDV